MKQLGIFKTTIFLIIILPYFLSLLIGRLIFYLGHLILIIAYMFLFNQKYMKLHYNEIIDTGILDKEN